MPTDIAIHPVGNPIQGNHPPALSVPVLAEQNLLAESTDSNIFSVPASGAVAVLTATVKLRVDIRPLPAALNAPASAIVLFPEQPRMFALGQGTWRFRTALY